MEKKSEEQTEAKSQKPSLTPGAILLGFYTGLAIGAIAVIKLDNGDSDAALCRGIHDGYAMSNKSFSKGVSHVS